MLTVAKTTITEKDLELLFEDSFVKSCLEKHRISKKDLLDLYCSVSEQAGCDDLFAPVFWDDPLKLLYKGFLYSFLNEGEKEEMEIVDHATNDTPSSIAFVGKKNVFSLAFVGRNKDGFIRDEDKTNTHEVEDPFGRLDEKTRELAMKNTEELFGMVKAIHPDCFPKELLRMKSERDE